MGNSASFLQEPRDRPLESSALLDRGLHSPTSSRSHTERDLKKMHFHAYVLVPFDVKDVEEKVSELMAPYDATCCPYPSPRMRLCVRERHKELASGQYAMSGRLHGPATSFPKRISRRSVLN